MTIDGMQSCPHCGASYPKGLGICSMCGNFISGGNPKAVQRPRTIRLPDNRSNEKEVASDSIRNEIAANQFRNGDRILERYEIVKVLSTHMTGEGCVYLCADNEQENKKVAVKVYQPGVKPKDEVIDRLKIPHPNIVKILGNDKLSDGRFVEVMEYCTGGSLEEEIKRSASGSEFPYFGPYDETAIKKNLLPPLLAGIRHLHDIKIIHRDIKPSNILFLDNKRTHPVLVDFGISSCQQFNELAVPTIGFDRGTLRYVAPEVGARGMVSYADWYALGVLLADVTVNDKSKGLLELINGLINGNYAVRWGAQQVHQWIKGEPITDAKGKPYGQLPVNHSYKRKELSRVDSLEGMADALDDPRLRKLLSTDTYETSDMVKWIGQFDLDLRDHAAKIAGEYNKQRDLGFFVLQNALDPDRRAKIAGQELASIASLRALVLSGKHDEEVQSFLSSGKLEQWFLLYYPRCGEANSKMIASHAAMARAIAGQLFRPAANPEWTRGRGVEALKIYLQQPAPPYMFLDKPYKKIDMLTQAMDQHPDEAIQALKDGHLVAWLLGSLKMDAEGVRKLLVLLNKADLTDRRKLETVLQNLDPSLKAPSLEYSKRNVNRIRIPLNSRKTIQLQLFNTSRGYIEGTVGLKQSSAPPEFKVEIANGSFAGKGGATSVTIDTHGLSWGREYVVEMEAFGNMGRIPMAIRFRATAPWGRIMGKAVLTGAVCGLTFYIFRKTLGTIVSDAAHMSLTSDLLKRYYEIGEIGLMTKIVLLAIAFVGFCLGGIYLAVRGKWAGYG